jgi:hypothetical protein
MLRLCAALLRVFSFLSRHCGCLTLALPFLVCCTTSHYTNTVQHDTTLHYTTLHYTTLHTLHYATLHYTTHTTLHYTTLYTTLHETVGAHSLTHVHTHSVCAAVFNTAQFRCRNRSPRITICLSPFDEEEKKEEEEEESALVLRAARWRTWKDSSVAPHSWSLCMAR